MLIKSLKRHNIHSFMIQYLDNKKLHQIKLLLHKVHLNQLILIN